MVTMFRFKKGLPAKKPDISGGAFSELLTTGDKPPEKKVFSHNPSPQPAHISNADLKKRLTKFVTLKI